MKHLLLTIGILCGIALSSCIAQDPGGQQPSSGPGGQQPPNNRNLDLESLKIGFLTRRMNLTPEEGQRFWPIYNQYTAEMRQAQLAFRDNRDVLARDEVMLNIRKKYNAGFSRVLPRDKVNIFFRSETDFSNFVQREWMQRRQQRMLQRRPMIR